MNPYWGVAQEYGFYQGNRPVGADLGVGDEGGLVAVHASLLMYRNSFFEATLGPHFGHTVVVGSLALVADTVSLGTCKTEAIIGDQFEDFR